MSKAKVGAVVMFHPNITGCSDGNCIFQDNSAGMHTNGGCRCERELQRHPQGLKAARTIRLLRAELRKHEPAIAKVQRMNRLSECVAGKDPYT